MPQDFEGRLTITPTGEGRDKEASAKLHLAQVTTLHEFDNHLPVLRWVDAQPQWNSTSRGWTGWFHSTFTRTIGMCTKAEVYDAEMAALMWAARDAVKYAETHSEVKHLHFFADNSAAVRAIFEPKLRRGQSFAIPFQEAITGFLDSDGTHTFGIAWTPGHQDIPDVERADALDKDAVTLASGSPHATLTHAKRKAREITLGMEARVEASPSPREVCGCESLPSIVEATTTLRMATAGGVWKGDPMQSGTRIHWRVLSPVPYSRNYWLPMRGTSSDTGTYPLRECPRFNEYRHILRDVSEQISLPVILGIRKGIDALASFIDESGAFTRENLRRRNSNSHNSMSPMEKDNNPHRISTVFPPECLVVRPHYR